MNETKIEFIFDKGFMITHKSRKILLCTTAVFNKSVSDTELLNFSHIIRNYLSNVGAVSPRVLVSENVLRPKDINHASEGAFYRFLSEDALNKTMNGSIRLGSPSYYSIDGQLGRGDPDEGVFTALVEEGHRGLVSLGRIGFNTAMLCGTSVFPDSDDLPRMLSTFGQRIIRIDDVAGFAEAIRQAAGASQVRVFDVRYDDAKVVRATFDGLQARLDAFHSLNSADGTLSDEGLALLAEVLTTDFYDIVLTAALMCKPIGDFIHQAERRILFEFKESSSTPFRDVYVPEVAHFIEEVSLP